ncbi:MAG: SGNH/GDSL hydrolase family protein, partial [Verrucomicrobiota bacterium]
MKAIFCVPLIIICAATTEALAENPPWLELAGGVPNFVARMEKEREATVAFIGGSITQNAKGHNAMVPAWLRENWSDVDFTFINAGLSSTCSQSGAFRLDRDVLSKGDVDLLVVEFAVNDDQDAGHSQERAARGLEGIVRQYFAANPTGDMISVQFVNLSILDKLKAGDEAISVAAHKSVARHYQIPSVDVGLALSAEIESGRMSWKENYGGVHPNQEGYRFASDLIISVIEDTISGETPQVVSLRDPLDPAHYGNARLVDPQDVNWLGGWQWAPVSRQLLPTGGIRSDYEKFHALRSDEVGSYLYYSFQGSFLGAFVLAGPDAGVLEVSIDAGPWQPVDLFHRYSE